LWINKSIIVFSIYFVSTRAAVAGEVEEIQFLETFPGGYNKRHVEPTMHYCYVLSFRNIQLNSSNAIQIYFLNPFFPSILS
jgi:hypothetical protein